MVFGRTIIRLAGQYRQDVNPSLKKLWKKYYFIDGQVTRHMSPFEQKIMTPLFKDAFSKVIHQVKDFTLEAGWAFAAGILLYNWAEAKHKEIAFHHRS